MRTLKFDISCGEKTCAESPGVLCQFITTRMDGSRPRCVLFDVEILVAWESTKGWLLRDAKCLAKEV